jgi:chemotaxis family two-component system sensor histidine kinase/response regulator PixL
MAINSDIRDQAYQFFVEEIPELLQTLESGLLTLSQNHSPADLHHLMRAAHTIKGGAASVELEAIATLAHRLENILKALYSDTLSIDTALENQLLQAYDLLRLPLIEQIQTGHFDEENALATADLLFTQIETQLGDALLQTSNYIPSSADMGFDFVRSMLEVDVGKALDNLAEIVAQPQNYDVSSEFQSKLEVFAGMGELLNLPEFGAIAETARRALEVHPEQTIAIAQQALMDFEHSRQFALSGMAPTGTGPSSTLIHLAEASPPVSAHPLPTADETALTTEAFDELAGAIPLLDDLFGAPLHTSQLEIEEPAIVGEFEPDPLEDKNAIVPQSLSGNLVRTEVELETELEDDSAVLSTIPQEFNRQFPFSQPSKASASVNLTVRVDSEQLDLMNNLVGELTINRDRLAVQNEQMQKVLRDVQERFTRFQNQVNYLRTLSDQMAVAPKFYRSEPEDSLETESLESEFKKNSWGLSSLVTGSSMVKFDALEMDSYSDLHSQIQEILEDVVQLEESIGDITLFSRQANQAVDQQRQLLTTLRGELIRARMLPLGEVLNRFPRLLRDLSTTYQKSVKLKLTGTDVLVDRAILEKLYDPLLHLLRNAFDHGIEPVEERLQQGKSEQGQIEIRAYRRGNQTIVEVKDDGRGLNLNRICERAVELGWITPNQLASMSPEQLFDFIFEPGFSTAQQISELSGRGIGLDVVKSQLRAIKGSVAVNSSPRRGTTFSLHLPLTLTIAKLLIVKVSSVNLALPLDSIEEILTLQADHIKQLGNQRFLRWREQTVPTYRLADLLDYACPLLEVPSSKTLATIPSSQQQSLSSVLILTQGQQSFALEVDSLMTEQELVIKPFGAAIATPSYVYGCTILGDGSLVPVIDGISLLALGANLNRPETTMQVNPQLQTHPGNSDSSAQKPLTTVQSLLSPTILIVDDAATLRRTLALSLQRAGFRVLQARDGQEAIQQLQQFSFVQLVICDIEMPNMNGFEFLNYRRRDPQLSQVPIMMLTSRSNNKHRWLAMQLGATAYFTKPYLEQELLTTLKNLIQQSYSTETRSDL